METLKTALGAPCSGGYYRFEFPGLADAPCCGLSPRSQGPMTYDRDNANRAQAFARMGIEPSRVVGVSLSHSRRVSFVGKGGGISILIDDAGAGDPSVDASPNRADGILALDSGYLPCVTVADCMPIYLYEPAIGAFGVLHSGWKGTGILRSGVNAIVALGGRAERVRAVFGPRIGTCCYAVDEARAAEFERAFGAASVAREGDRASLDLVGANLGIAIALGIASVLVVDACTSCDASLGSYRREGPERFTRMAAFCGRLGAI